MEWDDDTKRYKGYKEIDKPADALSKTLLNTNISRISRNESISDYQDALLHYSNVLDGMCEKETMRVNSLGPALPSPSPSPQPLASAEWKRCCHRRRESAPLVLAAAESGFPDQSSLNTEIAEIFYDKSIPENVKAELYWIVLYEF